MLTYGGANTMWDVFIALWQPKKVRAPMRVPTPLVSYTGACILLRGKTLPGASLTRAAYINQCPLVNISPAPGSKFFSHILAATCAASIPGLVLRPPMSELAVF